MSPLDPHDQLRHDLKASLTIVSGRAQLIARAIRRSPSLTDAERAGMLENLAVIDGAVLALVARIDALGVAESDR